MAGLKHPVTPDGRYFVVRGRLWRLADPAIDPARKAALVHDIAAAAASRATTGKRDLSCCLGTYFARLRGARYLFVDWRG
jgi:hypothetical protein